jgi:hypothetical protein
MGCFTHDVEMNRRTKSSRQKRHGKDWLYDRGWRDFLIFTSQREAEMQSANHGVFASGALRLPANVG